MNELPSRELTCSTWGKGKSSSKVPWEENMLAPGIVYTADDETNSAPPGMYKTSVSNGINHPSTTGFLPSTVWLLIISSHHFSHYSLYHHDEHYCHWYHCFHLLLSSSILSSLVYFRKHDLHRYLFITIINISSYNMIHSYHLCFCYYGFFLSWFHHGIFFTPRSLESWPAFSKRHPHPAFLVGKSVVGPRKLPEKDDGFFPQLGCWKKKKGPQPLRRYLGLKSIFADEPWVPNGFFPCFEEWTLKKQGASSKVWVPMSPGWDFWSITCGSHWIGIPKWSFESVPLEDSDWLLNLFRRKNQKSRGQPLAAWNSKNPFANHQKYKVHATLSHLLKKSKDLPHKNIEKTPYKTSFFTLRENNFSLHFCGIPPTKLPDIEPPYGHAPQ